MKATTSKSSLPANSPGLACVPPGGGDQLIENPLRCIACIRRKQVQKAIGNQTVPRLGKCKNNFFCQCSHIDYPLFSMLIITINSYSCLYYNRITSDNASERIAFL
jgi:hypothetical protein